MDKHRFGGRWTETKLGALREYLQSYTTALKTQSFRLHYIDAFAGSGAYVPGDGRERQGSTQIALQFPFDEFHFIELNERRCQSLRHAAEAMSARRIEVIQGDANGHLSALCERLKWKSDRAVLFLDPYGMNVEWSTLQAVAGTGAIDVWYLFPLNGVTRQLAIKESKLDEDKQRSLDRSFGTPDWRQAFYGPSPTPDLFGGEELERHADVVAIENWITDRLRTLFPLVEGPEILKLGSRGRADAGPRIFALYFLASTRSNKGQDLARRIAKGVLGKIRREAALAAPISPTISSTAGSLWEGGGDD